MKNAPFLTALLVGLAFVHDAAADLININLTHVALTGTNADGTGTLGGGTWNLINIAEKAGPNALVKSDGTATAVTAAEASIPFSSNFLNGNPVQGAAWGGVAMTTTIEGLLPNQVYKVAIYTNRVTPSTCTVNGVIAPLPTPGVAVTVLPGAENVDYVTFIINATATGQIIINSMVIAGIQIEGLIDAGESGPQIDCRIKKQSAGEGGKGDGLYSLNTARSQSVRQKTIGRRAKRYYVNIENDGEEIDSCYAMAFFKKKQATIKVIDRSGAANVTAEVIARNYRYDLDEGSTRRFKVVVKPKSRKRATINVQLCGSPSTLVENKQDCSTCVLKVKN